MDDFAQRWTGEISRYLGPKTQEKTSKTPSATRRSWMPPVERMPPAIQFAVRVSDWFRTKCSTAEKKKEPLRMVGQLSLGGKRHLTLVEVGAQRFLVGGGPDSVTVVVPVAENSSVPPSNQGPKADCVVDESVHA